MRVTQYAGKRVGFAILSVAGLYIGIVSACLLSTAYLECNHHKIESARSEQSSIRTCRFSAIQSPFTRINGNFSRFKEDSIDIEAQRPRKIYGSRKQMRTKTSDISLEEIKRPSGPPSWRYSEQSLCL